MIPGFPTTWAPCLYDICGRCLRPVAMRRISGKLRAHKCRHGAVCVAPLRAGKRSPPPCLLCFRNRQLDLFGGDRGNVP